MENSSLRLEAGKSRPAVRGALRFMAEAAVGAVLSRGVLLGSYAPLGAAWAAASASAGRLTGYASLLGAVLGYCVRAQVDGLRYAAAAVLAAAVVMIFREKKLFIPAVTAGSLWAVGAVYVFTPEPEAARVILYLCEGVFAGAAAWFYVLCRHVTAGQTRREVTGGKLGQWELWREADADASRRLAVMAAAVSVCVCLGSFAPVLGIRLGSLCALLGVLAASAAGTGAGATAGLLLGAAVDLRMGVGILCTAVYGFLGLFCALYRTKGAFAVSLAFILSHAAALPWMSRALEQAGLSLTTPLFEAFTAAVLYLCFSGQLHRLSAVVFPARGAAVGARVFPPGKSRPRGRHEAPKKGFFASEADESGVQAAGQESDGLRDRLDALRGAFEALRTAASVPAASVQDNPATVVHIAAERTCRGCSLRDMCWSREYSGTRSALGEAMEVILRRGHALPTDFPPYFAARCLRLTELTSGINDTMAAMRYQQRFRRRVREDNLLLCAQYDGMLHLLEELMRRDAGFTLLPEQSIRLREALERCGVNCGGVRVQRSREGRLSVQLSCAGRHHPMARRTASQVLGRELEQVGEGDTQLLSLREAQVLHTEIGTATAHKQGEEVCGDRGVWFHTREGKLCLLICDGMGTGFRAQIQSGQVAQLMERFLQAGVEPATVLRLVCPALSLRGGGDEVISVDLAVMDLYTGDVVFYKCGAAASVILHDGKAIRRIGTGALPAGGRLTELSEAAVTRIRVQPGDRLVMLSDGVEEKAVLDWAKIQPPGEQAGRILEAAGGADDRTVLVCAVSG